MCYINNQRNNQSTPLVSTERQIFYSADESLSNYKVTSAVWKLNRCQWSCSLRRLQSQLPQRTRTGPRINSYFIGHQFKVTQSDSVGCRAGPGALVMRFILLLPILSQHGHPGYIYPPLSLTHLICHCIATWMVCLFPVREFKCR